MKFTLLAVMSSILFQGGASPKDLLILQRPLTVAEMDTVVNGIRQAIAGMTLRVSQGNQAEHEILMGRGGMPQMIRSAHATGIGERKATVTVVAGEIVVGPVSVPSVPEPVVKLIEYTGLPARRCNGAPASGEMVIEYLLNSTTDIWTATAREPSPGDIAIARPLEMLRTTGLLRSGDIRLVGNRTARAIVSPLPNANTHLLTGDPAPNPAEFVSVQALWVDTSSMLPLRWEVSQRQAIVDAIDFVYEPLEFERPAGIEAPKCIS
jgi:hypothetical protein